MDEKKKREKQIIRNKENEGSIWASICEANPVDERKKRKQSEKRGRREVMEVVDTKRKQDVAQNCTQINIFLKFRTYCNVTNDMF